MEILTRRPIWTYCEMNIPAIEKICLMGIPKIFGFNKMTQGLTLK